MNIVRKDIDQNNAVLTVQIEKADYSANVEKTLRDYRKKANIPGFRPGMVPMGLMTKMYGKAIKADEINKVAADALNKYITDNQINILGEPLPAQEFEPFEDFDQRENFEFPFEIGIAPEFEVAFDKKDKVKYYEITADNAMIENQVKSYTSRYGRYTQEETVEERDMVKGEIMELEEAEAKAGGIQLSDAVLTPAYLKNENQKSLFNGAKKGDVLVFNPAVAFDNDAELASFLKLKKEEVKDITSDFSFTITGITRYHESEINQDLFDKVFGEGVVSNEEEFRAKIAANIEQDLKRDSDYKFGVDAREMLVKKYEDLTFPDTFLKRWLLGENKNMTQEALEADYPKMIEDLKWQLISNKIAKTSDVKVENEDIEEYAKNVARSQFAQYGMIGLDDSILENYAKDMLKKEETLKNIYARVFDNKVIDVVKNNVKLDVKQVSIEEFNKMFEA